MIAFFASPAFPGREAGALPHSRSALALAIAGHVIGAFLMIKLLEIERPTVTPPILVEILQPEVKKEEPPPPPKKKQPPPPQVVPEPVARVEPPPPPPQVVPEPKVEQPPPPPQVVPEPVAQVEPPPPPPAVQPIRQQRRAPLPDQIRVAPQPDAPLPPVVRRPVETVQAPPPPMPVAPVPRTPVRDVPPPPVLTAREPTPVPTVAEPPRLERPTAAPEAPRVAPREPPRRAVPVAAPAMEVAAAPMAEMASDVEEPAPAPLPIGPVPEGPEIDLDAAGLTALYLRNPKPGYPAASRRLGEQGTVQVRAFINKTGDVKSVELKRSSGFPRLDRAALDSIKGWKFTPAMRDDKPIDAAVVVPMKFSLNK